MDKVLNIGKHLTEAALRYPDRVGLVHGDLELSWKQLNQRVDAFAAGLKEMGFDRGDIAYVLTPNNVAAYETIYSTAKLGLVSVPLNFRATPTEMVDFISSCPPKILISHEDNIPCAEAALEQIPDLKIVIIGEVPADKIDRGWLSYETIVDKHMGAEVHAVFVTHEEMWRINFSSGSTGKPKACIATFGQIAYTVVNRLADVMVGVMPDHGLLAIGPLSHGTSTAAVINTSRAAKIVMLSTSSFREEECWDLIEKWRITSLFLVPTMLMRLIRHPSFEGRDTSSLKHVVYAGAPISRPDQKVAIKALGHALVQYYGSGESLGHGTVLRTDMHTLDDNDPDLPIGSIGIPRTGTDLEIMSDDMEPLPVGEAGLLCIRRGPGTFGGYYGAERENIDVFRGDWLLTGDIAKLDERGFVFILGRTKDMYKSGGMQVFPSETEKHLVDHPAVAEAYVIPFADSQWGEVGVAVVALHEGQSTNEEELINHLRELIAGYKIPKRVYIWDEIERASNGKVLKPRIKELVYERSLVERDGDVK